MKAIIFDMDGTILNTIEDITAAVNYILEKYNLPKRDVNEVRFFVGNGLRKTLERSVPENISAEFVDGIYEEFVAYYKSNSNINTKPYDGIVDAIKTLKEKGYKLAVVSNKRQEAVEKLCDDFYTDLFDEKSGDREGIKRKPDSDMVDRILTKWNISKQDAIYIGDSDVDIKTAENAGLKGIFVSWGFRGREFLLQNGAEIIVDTPEEMVKQAKIILPLNI